MIEKVTQFIASVWESLIPFQVINHFEKGVILRLGKFSRVIEPGLRWKIPFIEEIWSSTVVARTVNLAPQTLTTHDGKNIVVSTVITSIITDIKTALLEVDGVEDVMEDIAYGAIGEVVSSNTWDDLIIMDLQATCLDRINKNAKKYGITITNIQFCDIACIKTYRLMR